MITIDHQPQQISVAVFGEFTLADYREFEDVFTLKSRFEGPMDVFIDLREMVGFTVDVVWEDLKFAREHKNDFRRIAVITSSQWFSWSAWITQLFVDAEVQVFEEEGDARHWLELPPGQPA